MNVLFETFTSHKETIEHSALAGIVVSMATAIEDMNVAAHS